MLHRHGISSSCSRLIKKHILIQLWPGNGFVYITVFYSLVVISDAICYVDINNSVRLFQYRPFALFTYLMSISVCARTLGAETADSQIHGAFLM